MGCRSTLEPASDAGWFVVPDAAGAPAAQIAAPWARHTAGNPVPTRYEQRGDTIVQTVEHRRSGVTYPVVADPTFVKWWGIVVQLKRSQTNNVMAGMAGAAVAGLWIPDPTLSKIVASVLGLAAGYANWAYNRGACLAVTRPWAGPGVVYHYYGGACR